MKFFEIGKEKYDRMKEKHLTEFKTKLRGNKIKVKKGIKKKNN